MKAKLYRQGDVLIERIAKLPKNLKSIPRENGRVILAHGEVTNHSHSIAESHAILYDEGNGASVLEVADALALLVHEEHATITLEPGVYRVRRQREYTPTEIRRVAD